MGAEIESVSTTISTEHNSKIKYQSRLSRFITFLRDDIDTKHVDFQLTALGFATGIVDVVSYQDFSVFASNQTGNTVLLAICVSGVRLAAFGLICASLFSFILAGFISGQLGHRIGDHRRWWLIFNNFLQTTLIFIVVALLSTRTILSKSNHAFILVLLLATSFGCQMAMAKRMSCPEIPTVVLTTPFMELVTDPNLFKRHNSSRNRRLLYVIFFISGVITGSFSYAKINSEITLVISGTVKGLVALSFFLNPKTRPQPSLSE